MDTTSATAAPPATPEEREPGVNWSLLRRLARRLSFRTGVQAPEEGRHDTKPTRDRGPVCRACGVKYPGGMVCGYCRARVAELRAAAGGGA